MTHLKIAQVSVLFLAIGASGVVGTVLSSRLLTWNLRRTHILVPLLTGLLVLGLLLVGARPLWTAVVLVLLGVVNSVLPVAWDHGLALAVPDEAEGAGGLQIAAIQLGMTLGAACGGVMFYRSGSPSLLLASSAALIVGAGLIWKGLNHRSPAPAHP